MSGDSWEYEDASLEWIDETLRMRGVDRIPARLFKFISADSMHFAPGLREVFLRNRIYLSSRKDFNDPFDSLVPLERPKSCEDVAQFLARLGSDLPVPVDEGALEDWTSKAQTSVNLSMDRAGIYSLTDNPGHPLMWAHYASSHRGVALIFRHGIEGTFGAFPVRYQDDYPCASVDRRGIDVYCALVKGNDWAYEGEWRIVESAKAGTWKELENARIFDGVVLGARVTQHTADLVSDLARQRVGLGLPPIHLYRAMTGDSFHLHFDKFMKDGWLRCEL